MDEYHKETTLDRKSSKKKKTMKDDFKPSDTLLIPLFEGIKTNETINFPIRKRERIIEENESELLDTYSNEEFHLNNKDDLERLDKYLEIKGYLREIRQSVDPVEILVIGQDSSHKDNFVECLVGVPFLGKNLNSSRIIEITLLNDEAKSQLECLIEDKKKPHTLSQITEYLDKEIDINNSLNNPPIRLTFKHKNFFDLKIINTPSIKTGLNSLSIIKCIEKLMMQNVERRFVLVQNCGFDDDPVASHVVYPFDPQFSRTYFVNSDFNTFVNSEVIRSPHDFEEYTESIKMKEQPYTFWLTLPNTDTIKKTAESETPQLDLLEKLIQIETRDEQKMVSLQVEKGFSENYGTRRFKSFLNSFVVSKLQSSLPEVRNNLKTELNTLNNKISQWEKILLRSIDQNEARKRVTFLTGSFCEKVSLIASSSLVVNPTLHGKTSREEFDNNSLWKEFFEKCEISAEKSPFSNSKIFGVQQFERLFAELSVCFSDIECFTKKQENLNTILSGDTLENSEILPLNNLLLGVCLHVEKNLKLLLSPLLNASVDRAIFILNNFLSMVPFIKDDPFLDLWKTLPFLSQKIQDHYLSYLTFCSDLLKKRLLSEFFSSQTIYWQVTHFNPISEKDLSENPQKHANTIFNAHKERILKSVILLFYNTMLLPLTNENLRTHFSSVNSVNEKELEELCQQKAAREKAENKISEIKKDVQSVNKSLTGLEQLMWDF